MTYPFLSYLERVTKRIHLNLHIKLWKNLLLSGKNLQTFSRQNACLSMQKCVDRTYLIAGKPLEPYTTIIRKLDYESLTT